MCVCLAARWPLTVLSPQVSPEHIGLYPAAQSRPAAQSHPAAQSQAAQGNGSDVQLV
jgi:hypothetical protein